MKDVADDYIRRSLSMDLKDEMSNTELGAHMAANGMNWLAIVRGYAGCLPQGDVFLIESPCLPTGWSRLRFRLQWHGADFEVDLTREQISIRNAGGAQALPLNLCGKEMRVKPGEEVRVLHGNRPPGRDLGE